MSSEGDKDLSLVIYSTLDNLGFQKDCVSLRSKFHEEQNKVAFSKAKTYIHDDKCTILLAGSSSEGVQLSGSDHDAMFVRNDTVCLDHGSSNEQFTILETDYTNTAPGYTKVVSINESRSITVISLVLLMSRTFSSIRGYPYISSKVFRQFWFDTIAGILKTDVECNTTTSGPAVTNTFTVGGSVLEMDLVISVYFYGGEYLQRWANRARYYPWPLENTVKEISEMEGYVVPVGDKQSENQNFEWRICYTTAEKTLVSNLSSVQIKLYVLLKLLSKHVLKPVCKALTSYVIKNVVFWITETTPPEVFTPNHLVHLVLKSLHFIKHCLQNNHFPNYMIPERNLLKGEVSGPEKQAIISFLSDCLSEGRHVVLRIPKLYHCLSFMVKNPEGMVRYGKWRNEVERLTMATQRERWNEPDFRNISFSLGLLQDRNTASMPTETQVKLVFLVVPEFFSMILTGKGNEIGKLYHKRLEGIHFL